MKMKHSVLFMLISVLLVLSACSSNTSANGNQDDTDGITVTSQGKITSEPNTSFLNVEIQVDDESAQKAQDRVKELNTDVKQIAKDHNISEEDIKTKNFNVREMKDLNANKVTGFQVTHSLEMEVSKTGDLGNVIDALTSNNNIFVRNIRYDLTDDKRSEKENNALSKAIQNAREKADVIANEIGGNVQSVQDVKTTSVDYRGYSMPLESTDMAKSSQNFEMPEDDVSVSSTVQVRFKMNE